MFLDNTVFFYMPFMMFFIYSATVCVLIGYGKGFPKVKRKVGIPPFLLYIFYIFYYTISYIQTPAEYQILSLICFLQIGFKNYGLQIVFYLLLIGFHKNALFFKHSFLLGVHTIVLIINCTWSLTNWFSPAQHADNIAIGHIPHPSP